MKKWLLAAALLTACGSGPTAEELAQEGARTAAEAYYELLKEGRYDEFVSGIDQADSLGADYREQLVWAVKQARARYADDHGGIDSLRATRAKADSTLGVMQVFVTLHFHDSLSEEVVVPMTQKGDTWVMKN